MPNPYNPNPYNEDQDRARQQPLYDQPGGPRQDASQEYHKGGGVFQIPWWVIVITFCFAAWPIGVAMMIINHLLRMGKISAPQSWSQNNRQMVVRFCHQIHNKQPQCRGKELLLKIIGRVVKTHSAIIFACRKKRPQAKHDKDQNQNPENGISLSGLFLFCLHAVASTVVFISAYVCIFRIITVLSHIP